jgi:hypothetical protein
VIASRCVGSCVLYKGMLCDAMEAASQEGTKPRNVRLASEKRMCGKGNDWTFGREPCQSRGCADNAHELQGFSCHKLGRKGEILREERWSLWTTIRH